MNRTIGLIDTNYSVPGFDELAEHRPAANVPFGARYRLIDFALSNMANSRITTVGVVTPYYYRSLLDHIGAGKEWGLDRKEGGLFILPGSIYGLRDERSRFLMRDLEHNARYLEADHADYVLASDCSMVYNADYTALMAHHELCGLPVTLLFKEVDPETARPGTYLTLDAQGRVTDIFAAERGQYLFLNCFIADSTFLRRFLHDFHALNHKGFLDVLREQLNEVRVDSFPFEGYVGSVNGIGEYVRTSFELLGYEVSQDVLSPSRPIITKTHDAPPTIFAEGATVRGSLISAGCVIEGTVENSILFRGVRVERGAVVRDSIVMENGVIHAGAELAYCVCDKNVELSAATLLHGTPSSPCVLPKGKTL